MFSTVKLLEFMQAHGASGIIIVLLAICIWALRKIATNHLHHLDLKLDTMIQDISEVKTDVKAIQKETSEDRQRIAKIEGMIS